VVKKVSCPFAERNTVYKHLPRNCDLLYINFRNNKNNNKNNKDVCEFLVINKHIEI